MITVVNFADRKFKRNQRWSSISAKLFGKVNKVIEYGPKDIEKKIKEKNKESVKFNNKGFGNYYWKPFIVNKALDKIKEGDYLMYVDSGSFFLKSILPLVKHMEVKQKNILCFKLPLIEKQWTKRDTFLLMDCDSKEYINSPQILSGFFIVKKCNESISFLKSWQEYATDSRILSDDANALEMPNYKEFIEHRHDQSILSLLCKKNKHVLIEGDLSDYGCFPYRYVLNPKHIFDKHILENPKENIFRGSILCNRSGHPLLYLVKYVVRSIIYKFGVKV